MSPSRAQALRFWVLLGWVSFGGPAAQIALMHRELVERRRWVDEARFQHALAYCMALPGPEAQQLATYLGWALHGRWMGLAAGLLFILPGWGLMMALGWLYMTQGQEPLWQALLAGLKPAVVALVAWAAWRMARRSLTHPGAWGVAGFSAGALALGGPYPLILVGAIAYALLRPAGWQSAPADPREIPGGVTAPEALLRRTALGLVVALGLWGLPLVGLMWLYGADGLLVQSAVFFTQAALVTFGGAYAVLPYVMQALVQQYAWVSIGQVMDALALGETTPGPLLMVLVFLGWVAGWQQSVPGLPPVAAAALSACVVAYFSFLPSFALILLGAPWVERTRRLPRWEAPLKAVAAAVVGVIVHLAAVLAMHAWVADGRVNGHAVLLSALTLVGLWRWPRWGLAWVAGAAVLGAAL